MHLPLIQRSCSFERCAFVFDQQARCPHECSQNSVRVINRLTEPSTHSELFRRYCRPRSVLIGVLVFVAVCLTVSNFFLYSASSLNFVELYACPACFGVHLCHLFGTDSVRLAGWQRFSFFNNDLFNVKNIYYGTLNDRPVVFKKLAHQSEWSAFDDCQRKKSCAQHASLSLATLLPCANMDLISRFQQAFLQTTDLNPHDSEIALQTAININLEPIVLSGLASSGLPIPHYYGACGRVAVVSNEGSSLVSYLDAPFATRAHIARELLFSMNLLNVAHAELIVYYPDINLENFVYNEKDRRVKIIDLEYVIIVERALFSDSNADSNDRANHPNKFCRKYMPDFNVEQVCRYILSPSADTSGREVSSGFLHDIPRDIDARWNLTGTIKSCAQARSSDERMIAFDRLLDRLPEIV